MRKRIALIFVPAVVLALTACSHDEPRMVQMCVDQNGNYLPDYMCASPAGLYPMAVPYFMPWNTWHDTVEVHHHPYSSTDRLTGGSTRPPKKARVQSASQPGKVTVYSGGKVTKTVANKKANSWGTVTKSQKQNTAKTPKYGSYVSKPKTGKCC